MFSNDNKNMSPPVGHEGRFCKFQCHSPHVHTSSDITQERMEKSQCMYVVFCVYPVDIRLFHNENYVLNTYCLHICIYIDMWHSLHTVIAKNNDDMI